MSRYRGPRLRIIRRLGELPGLTRKKAKRVERPGQHGKQQRKASDYAIRLEEKQKLRYNYGINEKQLIRYVKRARRLKGPTGEILLEILENRLDNIIFRLGFAPTIPAARQLVTHKHFLVNGKSLNIPSYECQFNDSITVQKQSKTIIESNLQAPGLANVPGHLQLDKESLTGKILNKVERDWVALKLNELLIVEYYSRNT